MSLTGAHECRCGRICNGIREFEALESQLKAVTDSLEAEQINHTLCVGECEILRLRVEKLEIALKAIYEGQYGGLYSQIFEIAEAALEGK